LFAAHPGGPDASLGDGVVAARAARAGPPAPREVDRAIAALRITARAYDRAERSGLGRIERRLRHSKLLPPLFAANPAQAFFQLQRQVAERRRRAADGDHGDHLPPDEAVSVVD
jgi:hypothetical protein